MLYIFCAMNNVQIRFIPTDCTLYSICGYCNMFWLTFIAVFREHTQRSNTGCSSDAHLTFLRYTELSTNTEKKMLGCRRINLL